MSVPYSCKIPLEISCKSIALYYAYIKLPFTATFNISNAASLQVCFSNGDIITYHSVEALNASLSYSAQTLLFTSQSTSVLTRQL